MSFVFSRLVQQEEQLLNLQRSDPCDLHLFIGGLDEFGVSPTMYGVENKFYLTVQDYRVMLCVIPGCHFARRYGTGSSSLGSLLSN